MTLPSSPEPRGATTVHLVDASLDGGVQNHTYAVGSALADAGFDVCIHCPGTGEPRAYATNVRVCPCIWWAKRSLPKPLRSALIAGRFVLWTAPHIALLPVRSSVLHIQGLWKLPLIAWLILLARLRNRPLVHSPHNTFGREGTDFGARLLPLLERLVGATIVFSAADEVRVKAWGGRVVQSPLIHFVPKPTSTDVTAWRDRLSGDTSSKIILFAGYVRRDKGLSALVESASQWPEDWQLAVVGRDSGGLRDAEAKAEQLKVKCKIFAEYIPLNQFTAAIASADVVVCPYEVASQSGVLDFAKRLQVPSVATDVGGLGELATVIAPSTAPQDLTVAIEAALSSKSLPVDGQIEGAVVAHKLAYEIARVRASHMPVLWARNRARLG